MTYELLSGNLITVAEVILGACALACLVRAIIGPRTADRMIAVNMVATQVIGLIALVAAKSGETGFADIALIFAMLSFLGFVVLTKILGGKGDDEE